MVSVKDFFAFYPNISNEKFTEDIYKLNEFYSERIDESEEVITKGELFKHQKVISRFLSPHTNYDKLLLVHAVGTGKTCASFAIAEINKYYKNHVYFLSPSSDLNKQQQNEIESCFPEYTDNKKLKKSYYTFTTHYMIAKQIKTMSDIAIKKRFSNSVIIIDEVHKLIVKSTILTSPKKKYKNLDKKLKELEKEFKKNPTDELDIEINVIKDEINLQELEKDPVSNKELIEKLKLKIKTDKNLSVYEEIYRLLHVSDNLKIVLLSGTPMIDQDTEIIKLINLLLPDNNDLAPPYGKLQNLDDPENIKQAFKGRVSYLKSPAGSLKNFVKLVPDSLKSFEQVNNFSLNLVNLVMEDTQSNEYIKAWCKGIYKNPNPIKDKFCKGAKSDSLYHSAEQTSLLILPNDGKYIYGNRIDKTFNSKKLKKEIINKIWNDLESYSIKYKYLTDYIKTHNNEKIFIYSKQVNGGGIKTLKYILNKLGFRDYTYKSSANKKKQVNTIFPSSESKRFVILTGQQQGTAKNNLLKLYNNPKNATGKYIQIIVGSEAISQGYTLKDVQSLHLLEPEWNYSNIEQILGRVVRKNSHNVINEILGKEVIVDINLYCAFPKQDIPFMNDQKSLLDELSPEDKKITERSLKVLNSIDFKKYNILFPKDRAIKRIEYLMKTNAVDCPLFYEQNKRDDGDNSRNCDYELCNYPCEDVNMNYVKDGLPPTDIINTNYYLFYSQKQKEQLKVIIKSLFYKFENWRLSDILKRLKLECEDQNNFIYLDSIQDIITKNEEIPNFLNLNGYYLRNFRDELFISRNLLNHIPNFYVESNIENIILIDPIQTSIKKTYMKNIVEIIQTNDEKKIGKLFERLYDNKEFLQQLIERIFLKYSTIIKKINKKSSNKYFEEKGSIIVSKLTDRYFENEKWYNKEKIIQIGKLDVLLKNKYKEAFDKKEKYIICGDIDITMSDIKLKKEINKGEIKIFSLVQFYNKDGNLETNIEKLPGGSKIKTGQSFKTIKKEDAFEIAKDLNIKTELGDKYLKSKTAKELIKRNMWIKECPRLENPKGTKILEIVQELFKQNIFKYI